MMTEIVNGNHKRKADEIPRTGKKPIKCRTYSVRASRHPSCWRWLHAITPTSSNLWALRYQVRRTIRSILSAFPIYAMPALTGSRLHFLPPFLSIFFFYSYFLLLGACRLNNKISSFPSCYFFALTSFGRKGSTKDCGRKIHGMTTDGIDTEG